MSQQDVDFVKRDRKRVEGEDGAFVFKQAAVAALSFGLGVPVAIVGGLISLGKKATMPSPPVTKSIGSEKFVFPPVSPSLVSELKPFAERDFDVVVYGATGFTGELCARYLTSQYKNDASVKWAIAGRRKEALEAVRDRCLAINPQLNLEILSGVDSANESSLHAMCARTRVVVTTVGPFQNYGTPLVRACISTQTNCCDITGEVDWHEGLIENYDEAARRAGSRIVSFCGHDCVPWDVSAFMLHKKLPANEEMKSLHFDDEVTGQPSGGTVSTILESIGVLGPKFTSKLKFSPLYLTEDGTASTYKTKDASSLLPTKSRDTGLWGGPFVMAMVNAQVVKRGNALNRYGHNLVYSESRLAPTSGVLLGRYLQLMAMGPILLLPEQVSQYILPQPGQGPSEKAMDAGFLQVTGTAVGEHGTRVRSRIYFKTDPGYRDTARMLVETGLSIAKSADKLPRSGGVLTPGTCCAEVLLDRLVKTGSEFQYLSAL